LDDRLVFLQGLGCGLDLGDFFFGGFFACFWGCGYGFVVFFLLAIIVAVPRIFA
jgi:hypothetical protein